jgi:hypothetical protein
MTIIAGFNNGKITERESKRLPWHYYKNFFPTLPETDVGCVMVFVLLKIEFFCAGETPCVYVQQQQQHELTTLPLTYTLAEDDTHEIVVRGISSPSPLRH